MPLSMYLQGKKINRRINIIHMLKNLKHLGIYGTIYFSYPEDYETIQNDAGFVNHEYVYLIFQFLSIALATITFSFNAVSI